MIVSLRRLASLKSDVDVIAKTALVLETSTDDKKLIKLGALITIDDIREEMMKNHAMLEADDKERLPIMLSKNANKEKQIEHLVTIQKAISEWEVYMPGRLKFALSWTIHELAQLFNFCMITILCRMTIVNVTLLSRNLLCCFTIL